MQPVSCAGCQALQRRLRDLQAENERLRRQLEVANRAGKRQAAPFAKGQPTDQPKKPGRRPGKDYGTKAHRQPPSPEEVDEVHEAPLPYACPDCGGPLDETHVAQQFRSVMRGKRTFTRSAESACHLACGPSPTGSRT